MLGDIRVGILDFLLFKYAKNIQRVVVGAKSFVISGFVPRK